MNVFDKKKENMSCSVELGIPPLQWFVSLLFQIIFSVFIYSDM